MKSFISFLKLVLLIIVFEVVLSDSFSAREPSTCKNFNSAIPQSRLKQHIFCDYEPAIRSNKQSQNTTVNIMLIPKTMSFDDSKHKLTMNSWLKVNWMDNHLKWNPKDFEAVTELRIQNSEIWVPDLTVWNSVDLNSNLIFSSSDSLQCQLIFTGLVVCIPLIETTVHCSSDFENWPFETKICQINFASSFHFKNEIFLRISKNKIWMESFIPNQEWTIVNVTAFERSKFHVITRVIYEFHFKRHTSVILTLYVVPIIVLMLLTLVILWTDVNSVERIALACLNFMCHLLCLYDLHWQLPENGNQTPKLWIFYETSLVLSVFSLVLTVILRKLKAITTPSPKLISSAITFVLRFRIGRLFVLHEEEEKCFVEIEEETENNDESVQSVSKIVKTEANIWKHFARIIECLSFFSILLAYILMFLTSIPS